jgi:hypothetical protein
MTEPPLKKQVFVSQDHIGRFSVKWECANTTHKHIIPWYLSYKVVITYYFHVLEFTRDEAPKDTSKYISEFKRKRIFLRKHSIARCHKSNHLTQEVKTLLRHPTPATGSNTDASTQSLDFPLTTATGIAKREREGETCTQHWNKKSKAWATTLSRTYPSQPEGHKFYTCKGFKVVRTHAYLQLLLITFM